MRKLFTLFFSVLLLTARSTHAQIAKGKPFPSLGQHRCMDGSRYDFSHIRKPAVLLIGLTSCPHCRSVLQLLATRANTYARKGVDVLYMTYETSDRVRRETKKIKIPAGLHLIADRHFCIYNAGLTARFPAIYFIDRNGTVQSSELIDEEEGNDALLAKWDATVQQMR